jgi:hypothetical protein
MLISGPENVRAWSVEGYWRWCIYTRTHIKQHHPLNLYILLLAKYMLDNSSQSDCGKIQCILYIYILINDHGYPYNWSIYKWSRSNVSWTFMYLISIYEKRILFQTRLYKYQKFQIFLLQPNNLYTPIVTDVYAFPHVCQFYISGYKWRSYTDYLWCLC